MEQQYCYTLVLLRVVWGWFSLVFASARASSVTVKQTGCWLKFMCNLAWDFPVKKEVPDFQGDAGHQTVNGVPPLMVQATVPAEDPQAWEVMSLPQTLLQLLPQREPLDLLSIPFPSQGAVSATEGVSWNVTCVPRRAGATASPGLGREVDPSPLVEDLKVKQPSSTAQPQLVHWPYLFLLRGNEMEDWVQWSLLATTTRKSQP